MSKSDILSYFYTNSVNLTPWRILGVMASALLGALLIHLTYRMTCREGLYNGGFNDGNILLTLITTVIMLMISSNIVISLGMVGALSIVRFRTAVKDTRDTIFVFWSMVLGLCVGSQNFMLAMLSTLFIGVVAVLVSLLPQSSSRYTLILRGEDVDEGELVRVLHANTRRMRLETNSFTGNEGEWVYAVALPGKQKEQLIPQVRAVSGIQQVNLVSAAAGE